ncbi:MAG TPA: hypothetical protein VMF06_00540 [Candidatus Limnocylindria bacterium]|nr:hypothetical protein [Candidatus Limnocylindria bacterium]
MARDSRYFVIVGPHFWTIPEALLPDGTNSLYLLYDTLLWILSCNDTQHPYDRFTVEDLRKLGFDDLKDLLPTNTPMKP